ncbi:MAG: hypothetical protein JRE81_15500 [Deltaproteobacteria bacterium]|jgi:hypothetical protein|nr:hypothetical protein [Deltaproteobacteria bacterium]
MSMSMPRAWVVVLGVLLPGVAAADAVVVTRAMTAGTIMEAFVDSEAIVVELEVGEPELSQFPTLVEAATSEKALPISIPPGAELSFVADGKQLRGTIESVERRKKLERDEVSGEPLPKPGAEEALFVSLRYPLRDEPKTLVLSPPSKDGYAIADIGFVVYHRGVAVNDFRYLSSSERLELDWEDPFYSRFVRRALKRKFDSPMNVFLYVEPFEVRKEFVVRPLDLARFTDLDIRRHEPVPPERREALLAQIAEFLAKRAPVTIDGEQPEPILDRIHFLRRGLRMTRVVTPDEPIDGTNAIVGAIFVYPVDGLPREVRLDWDLFDERIQRVPGTATDEAGPMPYFLTNDDRQLHWVNFLKGSALPGRLEVQSPKSHLSVPAVFSVGLILALGLWIVAWRRDSWVLGHAAVALVAVAWFVPTPTLEIPIPSEVRAPSGEEAAPTIHALLYNVYRALDFRDEGVVFDRLAQSLAGDVLERVYLEMRKGLRLENQGGARVRVREVDLLSVIPLHAEGAGALRYRTQWNATGSVGHCGHTHMRTNQYEADLTLARIEAQWKIADIQILQEQRVTAP